MCRLIENEVHEIKVKMFREKLQIPHKCNFPFFKEVVTRLSLFSLKELVKQFELMQNHTMQSICSGRFMATMGLPCVHMMYHWREQTIPPRAIHPQWQIDTRESLFIENETNVDDLVCQKCLTGCKITINDFLLLIGNMFK
ncbi:hypothetical protein ACH5RR_012861 [Cinchona calisaya]|uniref:Uncharacterized protein n=1 Tax=Cinchona calisaya TaxID=153742 RepID=A0ABD3ACD2_9GENT